MSEYRVQPSERHPTIKEIRDADKALRHWHAETAAAALPFESRWTMLALRRVDAGFASLLREQRALFDEACIRGTAEDIEVQGAGLCRGYAAATRALEAADEPDDAYQIGRCPTTGTTVAIGQQKAAVERVRELHGDAVVWITPDEVAILFASVEGFKAVAVVKKLFPGAEIIDRHLHEGM